MLQNIREIGIFMILSQAVVHFSPGRQYEKYIKTVSGVIILLLFLRPFVQMAGGQWQNPSTVLDRLEEGAGTQDLSSLSSKAQPNGVEDRVKRCMEEEIATRLNRELAGDPCSVKRVSLTVTEPLLSVEVVIGARERDDGRITVEEITLGDGRGGEKEKLYAYRLLFAGLLDMEEEQVEVRWDGRD